jgi:threonine/homoserine/homoserine lactone efflux protein
MTMSATQVGAFVVASTLLIIIPGVDMALLTRQVVAYGRRAAFVTLAGLLTGMLTHTTLATIGLSAVLMASAAAYTAVKLIGAVYLVWVGVQSIWATRHRDEAGEDHDAAGADCGDRAMTMRHAYTLGFLSNVANPKIALFFLTFLPQFVASDANVPAQTLALGLLFCAMGCAFLVVFILALMHVAGWLRRPAVQRSIERVTGAVLVALGVRLAVQR